MGIYWEVLGNQRGDSYRAWYRSEIVVELEYLQMTWKHRNEGVLAVGCLGLLRLLGSRLTEQGSYLGLGLS